MSMIREYEIKQIPDGGVAALELLLNTMGLDGWELYPLPFPVAGKNVLVFNKDTYVTEHRSWDERVDKMVSFVIAEMEYPEDKVDKPELRKMVQLVMKETL